MSVSPRVPDLAVLDALVTVARAGSMGAAATELGLSQQAVSHRVAGAEKLLGLVLFRRSPRGVELTDAGRGVITWADAVLSAASDLDAGAAALRGDRRADVGVAMSNTVAEFLFPVWAAALRAREPGAVIRATPGNSDDVVEAIRAGEADLGFVEGPEVPAGLASAVVATDELVVVVPPAHPWAADGDAPAIDVATLSATPLVLREPGSGTRRALERAVPGLAPPLMELGSAAAVRSAAEAACAPAVMSSLAARREVEDGHLARVHVEGLTMPRALRAVWLRRRPPTGAAATLLALAVDRRGREVSAQSPAAPG